MPSLASGLMQGLTGYMQGQDRRRSMDMEDEAIAREEARRREDVAMRQAQMASAAEQMRQAREDRERERVRQEQMDRRTAYDRGEQPVEQVRETGGAMMGASGGGMIADLGTKAAGGMLTQQAKAPTYSIGDTGYVKAMPSVAERAAEMQAKQRASERGASESFTMSRDAEQNRLAMERDKANRASQERIAGMQIDARAAAVQPPKLRVVPAGTMKDFQGIQANLRELQDIEAALTDPKVAGEALGLKNMLPEWAATRGMSDPALTLRGKLSNVASGIFLERSGAAVTPSEAKRLEGWTANLTDNPAKAANAIKNMRAFYEQKIQDMQATYGEETGYRPLAPSGGPPAAGAPPRRPPLDGGWR